MYSLEAERATLQAGKQEKSPNIHLGIKTQLRVGGAESRMTGVIGHCGNEGAFSEGNTEGVKGVNSCCVGSD